MLTYEDIEDIKRVKARYFRYVDTKRWSDLRRLFTDDATFAGLWAAADGPDAFVASIRRNLSAETFSAHYGFMPDIVGHGHERARAIWSMQDYLLWPVDSKAYLGVSVAGQRGIRGYGHYEEEYLRTDDGWRIDSLRLSRLRVEAIVGARAAEPDFPVAALASDWLEAPGEPSRESRRAELR